MYMNIHSNIIRNSQEGETTQMSIAWWMDKQKAVYIHKVEYYLAIKRNEVLLHSSAWMNLDNIMLSERS